MPFSVKLSILKNRRSKNKNKILEMEEIREGWNCPVVSVQWQSFPRFLVHQMILPKLVFASHSGLHVYRHQLGLSVTCLMKLQVHSDIFCPTEMGTRLPLRNWQPCRPHLTFLNSCMDAATNHRHHLV